MLTPIDLGRVVPQVKPRIKLNLGRVVPHNGLNLGLTCWSSRICPGSVPDPGRPGQIRDTPQVKQLDPHLDPHSLLHSKVVRGFGPDPALTWGP